MACLRPPNRSPGYFDRRGPTRAGCLARRPRGLAGDAGFASCGTAFAGLRTADRARARLESTMAPRVGFALVDATRMLASRGCEDLARLRTAAVPAGCTEESASSIPNSAARPLAASTRDADGVAGSS